MTDWLHSASPNVARAVREWDLELVQVQRKPEKEMTATATFPKKSVWHSELVKASPVVVVLTDERVWDSKYEGKPPYIRCTVDGNEHMILVENDGVRATLDALPKNTPLTLHAAGSREHATITVDEAPTLGQISNARRKPQPPTPKANTDSSIAADYFEALDVASEVVALFKKKHGREPSEAERTIATSFFIERGRNPSKVLAATKAADVDSKGEPVPTPPDPFTPDDSDLPF